MPEDLNSLENIKKLFTRKSLLDVAIQIENFFDSMNLYVYPNWFEGELVAGPDLKRYWVNVTLKYDYDQMPDPKGAVVLNNVGVITKYEQTIEKDPMTVRKPDDYAPGTHKPKLEDKKIWLVSLQIPRRVIDEADLEDLDVVNTEIDTDDAADAEDTDVQFGKENNVQ